MNHRGAVVALMALVLVSTVPLGKAANKNFLLVADEGQFDVIVRALEASSVETTRTILEAISARIRPIPGVTATLLTIGNAPQRTQSSARST
jgi:multidrug efflux pump subunit AcrB